MCVSGGQAVLNNPTFRRNQGCGLHDNRSRQKKSEVLPFLLPPSFTCTSSALSETSKFDVSSGTFFLEIFFNTETTKEIVKNY
jgi:hypothetical protein